MIERHCDEKCLKGLIKAKYVLYLRMRISTRDKKQTGLEGPQTKTKPISPSKTGSKQDDNLSQRNKLIKRPVAANPSEYQKTHSSTRKIMGKTPFLVRDGYLLEHPATFQPERQPNHTSTHPPSSILPLSLDFSLSLSRPHSRA